jgi:hypothetical protein
MELSPTVVTTLQATQDTGTRQLSLYNQLDDQDKEKKMDITQEQKVFFLQAMRAFLSIYFERDLRVSTDVAYLLSSTAFKVYPDGKAFTHDPAMWEDWLIAIETVKKAANEGRLDTAV